MKSNKQIQEEQLTISEKIIIHRNLERTLKWLELYIEKANFYPDWKGQISKETIIRYRKDIPTASAEKIKDTMNVILMGLEVNTNSRTEFLGELRSKFCSWLANSGINANNCPKDLAECLININNVLIGKGEDFSNEQAKKANENSAVQNPLERTRNEEQTYKDVKIESKFDGSPEQGQLIFAEIKSIYEDRLRDNDQVNDVNKAIINGEMNNNDKAWLKPTLIIGSLLLIGVLGIYLAIKQLKNKVK